MKFGRTKTEILNHFSLIQSQLELSEERIAALEAELRAAREENERWHQYSKQMEKDAIYALWDDDPGVVYVAGGTGPGLVIKHFKDQRDTIRALVVELRDALGITINRVLCACPEGRCGQCSGCRVRASLARAESLIKPK